MRRVSLFMIAILTISSIKAQDLIVLRDATEVQGKVTAITEESVTYKRWSNLEGPTYTISKANVFYIKYANGEKDVMQSLTLNKRNTQPLTPIKFQGYGYLGTIFNANYAGPCVDLIFGMRIYEYLNVGIQIGFNSLISEKYHYSYYGSSYVDALEAYIPLGLNIKGYLTRGRKVNPYINCTLGGFIGVADMEGINGFHCQVGAGIDVKRFSFGIGYNGLVKVGTASCGYIQLGVRFGKN